MKNGDNYVKLNKSEFEKDLGVYVDKNLDFKVHMRHSSILGQLMWKMTGFLK